MKRTGLSIRKNGSKSVRVHNVETGHYTREKGYISLYVTGSHQDLQVLLVILILGSHFYTKKCVYDVFLSEGCMCGRGHF